MPTRYEPEEQENLTDDLIHHASLNPGRVAFARPVGGGWAGVTSGEFLQQVRRLAGGLVAMGIEPGERVALMSRTRYEWMLADYAIWTAGAVTVPIYETSSAEQVSWILSNSGAVAAIVETPGHAAVVNEVRAETPLLREVWQIDGRDLDRLAMRGSRVDPTDVEARRKSAGADSLATIVYTSGTTGRPKGCALTHRNLLSAVHNVTLADGVTEQLWNERESTLLFLPLAHVLARVIQLCAVHAGVRLGHTADIQDVASALQSFRPTVVLSVPRIFEKIYNSAEQKARVDRRSGIFGRAAEVAIRSSQALDTGGPSLGLRLERALFDRLVYRRIRAAMGGRVRYAVSGGAPLGARLGHFFRGIGINVLEGYGLTETCAAGTLNLPGAQRVGSVGRPVPGCAIRTAPDGELLMRGDHVFGGYWDDETATKECLDAHGWFATGDLGALDAAGFVTITGRKKELIVTSGGKNVAPAVLEDRLRAHWLIDQCVVVGDAQPFIGALLTLDQEALRAWRVEHGRPAEWGQDDLYHDSELADEIEAAVRDANAAVSRAEAIRRYRILPDDFTEARGQLTPTLKVRRAVVLEQYADEVAALYS